MPCASFSMLDGPGGTSQFLQSEVKIIHIIVQGRDGQNNNNNKIIIIIIKLGSVFSYQQEN